MTNDADDLYAKSDAIADQIRALEHERTTLRDKARRVERGFPADLKPAASPLKKPMTQAEYRAFLQKGMDYYAQKDRQ